MLSKLRVLGVGANKLSRNFLSNRSVSLSSSSYLSARYSRFSCAIQVNNAKVNSSPSFKFPNLNYQHNEQRNYSSSSFDNNNTNQSSSSGEKSKFSFFKLVKKLAKYLFLSISAVLTLLAICIPPGLLVDFDEESRRDKSALFFLILDSYNDTWSILKRFVTSCISITQVAQAYREMNKRFEQQLKDISTNKYTAEEEEKILIEYINARRETNLKAANLLLDLCLVNAGAYVKAGQYLASLNYAIPKEFTETLSVLQDKCQQHDFSVTEKILKEDFDKDFEEIFSYFEKEPIASASIAQVHKAVLRESGKKVAVKVQHPNLEKMFKSDLNTMKFLMWSTKKFFDFPFSWCLPEFEKFLISELDFVNEAANCTHFKTIFKDYPNDQIDSPYVHWNLTSKRILTMDFIEGVKLNDFEGMKKLGIDAKEISQLIVDSYSIQTFVHGFIHSDMHNGNLLVRRSPKTNRAQVVYLDHGCYKHLDEETRKDYCNLWKAAIFRDHENLKLYTEKFGIDGKYYPLFGLFLTFSNYMDKSSTAMVDQRKNMSKDEVKKMFNNIRETFFPGSKHKAQDLFNIIEEMFKNMKLDLILLMRANIQIRSITKELGKPINRFATMVEYCLRGLHYERENYGMLCKPHRESDSKTVLVTKVTPTPFFHTLTFQLLRFKCELLALEVVFVLARMSMRVLNFFMPGNFESEEAMSDERRETEHVKARIEGRRKMELESKEDMEELSTESTTPAPAQ
ncbi:predicted protein [Naegleria gruberi]|uniref:Predicted protein n=1 Tax=Naegleria gruberi TaxID=5762 RepID=D2VQL2_NAEGR|nr:uncharacterized protein NAEGRDRAFT_58948 [Naegleria gruberi]EFC40890.1 predicted protein [Naegleria gruberi]|eukprot:XP_002673634.1 predicted protein [Naegleria gruberi strain NEG-M]